MNMAKIGSPRETFTHIVAALAKAGGRPRKPALAAYAAAIALVLASGAHAQETLKFGVADALTGPSALFGKDQIQALQWAVDEINAKGGVNGRKLEAIIADHQ